MRQRELYTLSKRIRKINRADQELWMRGVIIYPLIIGLSCMDGVTRISDCTVRIQKDSYDEVYRYLRFVIKISNAFAA